MIRPIFHRRSRRPTARGRRHRAGMTLLEVMVSVSVLVVMGLIIAESMRNAIEYQRLLEDRDVTIRQARVAMSKLRREIEMAYLTPSQTAIETVQTLTGRPFEWTYEPDNRVGDHIWWISDVRKFQSHFPAWSYRYDLTGILAEIHQSMLERRESNSGR